MHRHDAVQVYRLEYLQHAALRAGHAQMAIALLLPCARSSTPSIPMPELSTAFNPATSAIIRREPSSIRRFMVFSIDSSVLPRLSRPPISTYGDVRFHAANLGFGDHDEAIVADAFKGHAQNGVRREIVP